MRRPRDRDFVETREGFIWCLVGYLHPPDRYTAYLKYTPTESGRWKRKDTRFRRELEYYHVRNIAKTLEFLKANHPSYVGFDQILDLSFSFVPREAVTIYHRPEERLQELLAAPADQLEKDVEVLVSMLKRAGGPDPGELGITGSILLKIHDQSFSDIDLVVYGLQATAKVRAAVAALMGTTIEPVVQDRRVRWRAETASRFGLAPDDVARLEARRWNYFQFRNRYVSVHPVRQDAEILDHYGTRRCRVVGPATIEATVVDATDSVFLPAHYSLADVVIREGRRWRIAKLISYEGLYCHAAERGDRILASGIIEQVDDGDHHLVVGAARLPDGGFLKLRV